MESKSQPVSAGASSCHTLLVPTSRIGSAYAMGPLNNLYKPHSITLAAGELPAEPTFALNLTPMTMSGKISLASLAAIRMDESDNMVMKSERPGDDIGKEHSVDV